jgi:hypothetical protein
VASNEMANVMAPINFMGGSYWYSELREGGKRTFWCFYLIRNRVYA